MKVTACPQTNIKRYIVQNPEQVSYITQTLVPTYNSLEVDSLNEKGESIIQSLKSDYWEFPPVIKLIYNH